VLEVKRYTISRMGHRLPCGKSHPVIYTSAAKPDSDPDPDPSIVAPWQSSDHYLNE
jgi:hypothetical protein